MSALIYLASTAYTGSTLASILLGSHPDVATISELTGISRSIDANGYPCSCGVLIRDCNFFKRVGEAVEADGLPFSVQDFRTRYPSSIGIAGRLLQDLLRRVRWAGAFLSVDKADRYNRAMIGAILHVSGRSVFLDASKGPGRIAFLTRLFPDALTVFHLTRDVRGYANSCRRRHGTGITKAAARWVRVHSNILRIVSEENVRYVRVRYEDLCADPAGTLREVVESCELQDAELTFAPQKMHVIGNTMRLNAHSRIAMKDSWKHELTEADQTAAYQRARELMELFGYDK